MKKLFVLLTFILSAQILYAQLPCSGNSHRQFDFWIGNWDVFAKNGKKAGDSKISLILDSCVVLEEWTSSSVVQGLRYAGKSFNTWNAASGQWQQTWVDNTGSTTEFLEGKLENNKMIFVSRPFKFNKDSIAVRRLTFEPLTKDKVRQHGEISKDGGMRWQTEYDLEYRRSAVPK